MARGDRVALRKLAQAYSNVGLDPSQLGGLQEQALGIYTQYRDSKALLGIDATRLRNQFKQQRGDIKQQGRLDLAAAAGAANDRGVLGSTSDVAARAAVKGSTASQIIAARDALQQGQQANVAQKMQAERDLYAGMSGLEAQRAAMKSAGAVGAYSESLYDWLLDQQNKGGGGAGGGSGGNGIGGGAGAPDPTWKQVNTQGDRIQQLLHKLATSAASGMMGPYDEEAALTRIWKRRNRNRLGLGVNKIPIAKLFELMELAKNPSTTAGGKPLL